MAGSSAQTPHNTNENQARNAGEEAPRQFRGDTRGNFRGDSRKGLAFELTQLSWQERASAAMRAHVGEDRHAAKKLSHLLECSPRTAENFLLGRTAPSGIHLLRAMAVITEFAAEVRRLTGMEASLDPLFGRDLAQFMTRASAYLDKHQSIAPDAAGK